jgi:hypothetical protein
MMILRNHLQVKEEVMPRYRSDILINLEYTVVPRAPIIGAMSTFASRTAEGSMAILIVERPDGSLQAGVKASRHALGLSRALRILTFWSSYLCTNS